MIDSCLMHESKITPNVCVRSRTSAFNNLIMLIVDSFSMASDEFDDWKELLVKAQDLSLHWIYDGRGGSFIVIG